MPFMCPVVVASSDQSVEQWITLQPTEPSGATAIKHQSDVPTLAHTGPQAH